MARILVGTNDYSSLSEQSPTRSGAAGNGVEDCELFYPYYRFKEENLAVDVASPEGEKILGEHSYSLEANLAFADANAEDLKLDQWLRSLAPSTELRQWFGHDPEKWEEFRKRYFRELDAHPDESKLLRGKMREGTLTIVFGSREERFNNATALKEYLENRPVRVRRSKAAVVGAR